MDFARLHVVIAGAAAAGAASALLFARRGARVTLCERVAVPRAVGAGIALAPNGVAVLDGLGVLSAFGSAVTWLDTPRIVDARGRTLLAPRLALADGDPRLAVVRRSDLQAALLDAVAKQPNIEAHFGAEVVQVERDGTVELAGGRRSSADLIVGADGVASRVREAGAFGGKRSSAGIRYVRGLVDGHVAEGVEAWTPIGLFGSFPVSGGTYFFTSAGAPALTDAIERRDLGAFRAAWTAAYPRSATILDRLASFDELLLNQVVEIGCERFDDGRLVLVGDAAHAMAPNLGQGANSALVDAAVLVAELDRAPDLAAGLVAYTRRRLPAVRRVQRDSARLGRLAEHTSPAVRFARDRLLLPLARLAGSSAASTRRLLQESPSELRRIATVGSWPSGVGG